MKPMTNRSRAREYLRCRWCGERLESKKHIDRTETYCYRLREKEIRSRARPRVKRVSDAYDDGKLKGVFIGTDLEEVLMRRQHTLAINAVLSLSTNGYRIPNNVDVFISGGFVVGQVASQRPWAVYVLINGKRRRRRFNNLYDAIRYHRKIHSKFPSSGIVSLGRSYELPPQLRFKKNKWPKRFKWCPRCCAPRAFKRREPVETFSALVKLWSEEKERYVWTERTLYVTECQLCGLTNRNDVFRRSNLPYEKRRIRQRATRVKPRVRTARGRQAARAKRARQRR